MKHLLLSFILLLNFSFSFTQPKMTDYPVIQATSEMADYKISEDLVKGAWRISPHVEFDTMFVTCFNDVEKFVFYTDLDSISFDVRPGDNHSFYVMLDTAKAFTIICGILPNYEEAKYSSDTRNDEFKFLYEENNDNEYLTKLRNQYQLDQVVQEADSDTERVLKILNWVHNRWKHDGNNEPSKNDAISILEEAKEGKNFRCVEYGIVASACLNAIGLKARVLSLMTEDVETRQYGAGHVVTEVFLNDLQKWVFIDGQWNVMPVLNGIPLNGVEFQKAIANNYNKLEIKSLSEVSKRNYVTWVYPYLYFFNVGFDNREGIGFERLLINDKSRIILVPVGGTEPKVFQIKHPIEYALYTNSLLDIYDSPN